MSKKGQSKDSNLAIPEEVIREKIHTIRGYKVLLDRDLAEMYGVTTGVLNQAVKRNAKRFPSDFMFRLNLTEVGHLRSQIVISRSGHGGARYQPSAFTEQGVAMLSGVLNSDRAIKVNIRIMRAFVELRGMALGHQDLWRKIEAMESKYDKQFKVVFDALRELLKPPAKREAKIGFH